MLPRKKGALVANYDPMIGMNLTMLAIGLMLYKWLIPHQLRHLPAPALRPVFPSKDFRFSPLTKELNH